MAPRALPAVLALVALQALLAESAQSCDSMNEADGMGLLQVKTSSPHALKTLDTNGERYTPEQPDPNLLKWEKAPSENPISIGQLTVQLDPDDSNSPNIDLEVSIAYSKDPNANVSSLLVHGGGPGTNAGVIMNMAPLYYGTGLQSTKLQGPYLVLPSEE